MLIDYGLWMGYHITVLLLSVERDKDWGEVVGLYRSLQPVNQASEDEEVDMMKTFLAREGDGGFGCGFSRQ